jgi:hypothetical protein
MQSLRVVRYDTSVHERYFFYLGIREGACQSTRYTLRQFQGERFDWVIV